MNPSLAAQLPKVTEQLLKSRALDWLFNSRCNVEIMLQVHWIPRQYSPGYFFCGKENSFVDLDVSQSLRSVTADHQQKHSNNKKTDSITKPLK